MFCVHTQEFALFRISMNKNGLEKIAKHPDFDEIAMQLIASVGVDDEGNISFTTLG